MASGPSVGMATTAAMETEAEEAPIREPGLASLPAQGVATAKSAPEEPSVVVEEAAAPRLQVEYDQC